MADPEAPKYNRGRRKAVSAASDSSENKLQEGWEPKVFPKTEEEATRIKNVMGSNILFKYLDCSEREIILNAMFQVDRKAGDVIIQQGDEGDNFYVIDQGVADIFKQEKKSEKPGQLVLVCKDGDSFGELALMYDAPRAATVIAKTDVKLWAMDRLTYKHILMDTTLKKRNEHKEFLDQVPFLQTLDPYERLKVADLSESKVFSKGDVILKQGEPGDTFYILEKGKVGCFQECGGEEGCVAVLKPGDYFGERALLRKEPRAASVKAIEDVEVLILDEAGFTMVLLPVEKALDERIQQYKTYKQLKEEGQVPQIE